MVQYDFDRLTFSLGHDFCGKTSGDPKNLLIIGEEGKMRVASGCKASALRRTIFPDGYDADGIRTYKLMGTCNISTQNGGGLQAQAIFDNMVLYPSPYMVVTPRGYTNHYYAGSERIASRIGDRCWTITATDEWEKPSPEEEALQNFWNIGKEEYPFGEKSDYNSPTTNTTPINGYEERVQYDCTPVELPRVDILHSTDMLGYTINCDYSYQNDAPVYYYHPDHLGSTSWVTNFKGNEHQFIAYLPYGEPLLNVLYDNYDSRYGLIKDARYKFTGKERDAETGYDYIEQRYYWWPGGFWLRPDPLLDKYIHLSPYAYCNGNPQKYVDPEGTKLRFAKGVSNDFKRSFAAAVQFMNRQKTSWILYRLEKRPEIIYLAPIEKRSHFSPKKKTIFWDPQVGIITYEGVILSPATVLNHEADHALQELENPEQKMIDKATEDSQYGNAEEKRVITGSEQITARRHDEISDDEVTRTDHEGQYYETISPISTTGKNEVVINGDKL